MAAICGQSSVHHTAPGRWCQRADLRRGSEPPPDRCSTRRSVRRRTATSLVLNATAVGPAKDRHIGGRKRRRVGREVSAPKCARRAARLIGSNNAPICAAATCAAPQRHGRDHPTSEVQRREAIVDRGDLAGREDLPPGRWSRTNLRHSRRPDRSTARRSAPSSAPQHMLGGAPRPRQVERIATLAVKAPPGSGRSIAPICAVTSRPPDASTTRRSAPWSARRLAVAERGNITGRDQPTSAVVSVARSARS